MQKYQLFKIKSTLKNKQIYVFCKFYIIYPQCPMSNMHIEAETMLIIKLTFSDQFEVGNKHRPLLPKAMIKPLPQNLMNFLSQTFQTILVIIFRYMVFQFDFLVFFWLSFCTSPILIPWSHLYCFLITVVTLLTNSGLKQHTYYFPVLQVRSTGCLIECSISNFRRWKSRCWPAGLLSRDPGMYLLSSSLRSSEESSPYRLWE